MLQIKEHDKNLKEQLNEEKIDNLAEKEFRVMIVKMIQVLRNRMELWIEKIQEKFNKDLGELKTNRDEQDNNKMKNALKESIHSRWGFPGGTSGKESACQCRR